MIALVARSFIVPARIRISSASLSPMIWVAKKRGIGAGELFAVIIGQESGNKHLVPSLAVRGASQVGGAPCPVIQKSMNRPIGGSRLNKSGENLGKFIDSLNDCPGDYALLSRN